ncbi:ABC transporter substrate-binding protein [Pendulispora albinea]|uniref:ABC transporter substrate-binding protein n=1 Tax=Pendulispora albinea TaxID=2741071 RepID=A0ABZ2M8P1_9BACT
MRSRPSSIFPAFAGLVALVVSAHMAGCSNLVDASGYHVAQGVYCNTHSDCTRARGPNWICRASTKRCVSLVSDDCKRVLGDPTNDDAIIVGSLFPIEGRDKTSGTPIENGVELAFGDFLQNQWLPPLPGKTQRRPMVLVACNDGAEEPTAIRAARHLTEEVGVPAIIGAAYSGVTTAVATQVTIPAGALLISPSSTSITLSTLQDDGLVWRTCPSDVIQADAHAALMKLIEDDMKAKLPAGTKLKVALLHKGDPYGRGLGNAFTPILSFNGAKATDPSNAPNYYRRIEYGNPDIEIPDYAARAKEIVDFAPHVIFLFGTTETVRSVIVAVEKHWKPELPYRPFYLMTDGSAVPQMSQYLAEAPEGTRQRMLGTKPGTVGPNFEDFKSAYRSRVFDGTSPEATWAVNAYDAFYMLTYSMVSLEGRPLTGRNIAEGFKRQIAAAPSVRAGQTYINDAFKILAEGRSFDYDGASGPLNLDTKTGEAASDILLWCVKKDESDKITDPITIPAVYFSATTRGLTGGMDAIRGFCGF